MFQFAEVYCHFLFLGPATKKVVLFMASKIVLKK